MEMTENAMMQGTVKTITAGRSCATVQIELADGEQVEAITTNSLARRMRIKAGKVVSAIVKDHRATIAA